MSGPLLDENARLALRDRRAVHFRDHEHGAPFPADAAVSKIHGFRDVPAFD